MNRPSLTQTVVMPTRTHDYLYDPNYTVSCQNDHQKAMQQSQTHDVIINPVYDNMFSSLGHFPASQYRLKIHQVASDLGYDRSQAYQAPNVLGQNRFRYFRRPIVPYAQTFSGQVVYARKQAVLAQQSVERAPSPFSKTVGVQTLYRESDAQTDPYSPEYVVRSSSGPPELLALTTLKFGAGLPAGVAELEMIERARIKRAWEAALPKVTDKESFQIRLKMMEEMELREWQERELEIKKLQEARLEILEKVIRKRQKQNDQIQGERLDRIWQRKLQERDTVMQKIQKKKVKALRKLADKRSKVENKVEKRDIIADYANFGSSVYAPKARDGSFRDKASATLQITLDELSDYNGLTRLEKNFPASVLSVPTTIPKSNDAKKSTETRRELHLQQELAAMDQTLKERKLRADAQEKPLKYVQKLEKAAQRPPTPRLPTPREDDDDLEQASLLLQRLIRGRVIQNKMYLGKERRLTLINELRTRHSLQRNAEIIGIDEDDVIKNDVQENEAAAQTSNKKEDSSIVESQMRSLSLRAAELLSSPGGEAAYDDSHLREPIADEEAIEQPPLQTQLESFFESNIQAEYIGKHLDFLTKELVRLREERRIAAMVRYAERTRRIREAEESGQRKMELKRREQDDAIFKQMAQTHDETVDSYLENVILSATEKTSDIQSRQNVKEYAVKLNEIVQSLPDDETVIADLVSAFLIPEVERETLREQVKLSEAKYLIAAHKALYDGESVVETAVLGEGADDVTQKKA